VFETTIEKRRYQIPDEGFLKKRKREKKKSQQ
jgi:hypothetical protein